MFRPKFLACLVLAALPAVFSQSAAQALRPPGDLREGGREFYQPAQGVDAAGMTLRIDRLENQVRSLTGQLEQMQFANKRLEDQLKKFQQDVEFRFQENSGKGAPAPRPQAAPPTGRRTERQDGGVAPVVGETTPLSPVAPTRLGRRGGDAFDPDANPEAPGAPRQLGSVPPSTPLAPTGRAPSQARLSDPIDDDGDLNAPVDLTRRQQIPIQQPPLPQLEPGGATVAAIPPPPSPREEFDRATVALRGGQFEAAETGFRSFLQKYPKNTLAADAIFSLGESYFRRQRPREAAEQYLKVSTDYAKSRRAPDALIKLGLSLEKLGAKEQACAAFGEVGRKYPEVNASVRASAERESKRAQC